MMLAQKELFWQRGSLFFTAAGFWSKRALLKLLKKPEPRSEWLGRMVGKDGWQALFDRKGWQRTKVPGGKYLRTVSIAKEALEIDKIVYAPLIKTHHAADFTGSIKLSMGFVKPFFDQITFHTRRLHEKLAELGLVIKPSLIVMDARKVFITRGPAKGELREPNLILASGNQIAIDVEGLKILQSYPGNSLESKNLWRLQQIKHSIELGLGPHNEKEYEVIMR